MGVYFYHFEIFNFVLFSHPEVFRKKCSEVVRCRCSCVRFSQEPKAKIENEHEQGYTILGVHVRLFVSQLEFFLYFLLNKG